VISRVSHAGGRPLRSSAARSEDQLGAIERQDAVGQSGQRIVKRLVAKLSGLLGDELERLLARARQDKHEEGQQQAEHRTAHEDQQPLLGRADRGSRWIALDPDRPHAVHGDVLGTGHGAVIRCRSSGGDERLRLAGVVVVEVDPQAAVLSDRRLDDRGDVKRGEDPAGGGAAARGDRVQRRAMPVERCLEDHRVQRGDVDRHRQELAGVGRALQHRRLTLAERRRRRAPVLLYQRSDEVVERDQPAARRQQAVGGLTAARDRPQPPADQRSEAGVGVAAPLERGKLRRAHGGDDRAADAARLAVAALKRGVPGAVQGRAHVRVHRQHRAQRCHEIGVAPQQRPQRRRHVRGGRVELLADAAALARAPK
jgi:hypothetical protein